MIRKTILILALGLNALALSGCFNATEDDQSVPWGRPAQWEGGAPGMGGY
ncbi:MAG: hypothetical protein HRT56_03685 [Coraliomargarita sp.]|nr:hypothetical protein [Coraliomargarita sp.]